MAKKRALCNEPDHLNSAETGKFLVGKQTQWKITDRYRKIEEKLAKSVEKRRKH